MELQQAVMLLDLTGKTLTEKSIKRAYNAKTDKIQEKAINAPTGELVQKYMIILDNLMKAQDALLVSVAEVTLATNDEQEFAPLAKSSIQMASAMSSSQTPQAGGVKQSAPSKEKVTPDAAPEKPAVSHKAPEIKYQVKSKKKKDSAGRLKFILLCIIIFGGGGYAYQHGFLDGLMERLKPIDETIFGEVQTDSGQLQDEIKSLATQLNDGFSDLKAQLKVAENDTSQENVELIERLRLAQRLANELAAGSTLSDLEASFMQGQAILSSHTLTFKKSQQTIVLLNDVKQGYQKVLTQFNASLYLYPAQQNALQARSQLRSTLTKYQLVAPSEIAQADLLMNSAKESEKGMQYQQAINAYDKAAPKFVELLERIENLQIAKLDAFKAKDNFNRTVEQQQIKVAHSPQADDLMAKAYSSSNEGNTTIATGIYNQAEQRWNQELDRVLQDAKANKVAVEEAKAAKAAKIAKEKAAKALAAKLAKAKADAEALEASNLAASALKGATLAKAEVKREKAATTRDDAEREKQAIRAKELTGRLVFIPDGRFKMGAHEGDKNELPRHSVDMRSFKIMEHAVTFEQWDACVSDGACTYVPDDNGWGRNTRPVITVSYNDITQQYIPWLNKLTGMQFSLPSEAQWEYAARAGTISKYSWGGDIGSNLANCKTCSSWKRQRTVPVKKFEPNPWGLFDMHGNVSEWTQDCWNDSYNGAPKDGKAWLQGRCDQAVLRGGSWDSSEYDLRSSSRAVEARDVRSPENGFRLVQY